MAEKSEQQINPAEQEPSQEAQQNQQELSEADKQVYQEIFKSLNNIDKKVKNAKNKLHQHDSPAKQTKNTTFKEIAEKLIESKQNSEIVNKEDLLADIHQSFERTVIDIYSQNQKLKKKMAEMEKIIKEQNHKIFQQHTKQQAYTKQIQNLKFQLAKAKDINIMANRGVNRTEASQVKKQTKRGVNKNDNQNNEDYDFWSMPQNEGNNKRKKQFVQNSGLWVNQKNIGESMFITQGRK